MASRKVSTPQMVFLEPPSGHRYVRSFLFVRRIDAPFARVHLIARTLFIVALSAALLRTTNADHIDPAGAALFWLCSFGLFLCSGMSMRVARLYFLMTIPMLFSLFFTWTLFNPLPGHVVLVRYLLYSGQLAFELAFWQLFWLAIAVGYFVWKRGIFTGLLLATLVTFVLTRVVSLPAWTFTRFSFFQPITVFISDATMLVSVTKVVGFSGMILCTITLVISCRDAELIGTLRQLRVPQPVIFFLTTVSRALSLALSDYETISQAQLMRAINARPRTFVRHLRDLGSMAVPMVAMMIRRSSEIGDAFLARGYHFKQANKEFYETSPWRWIDSLAVLLSILLLVFAVAPHETMTVLLLQRGS